MHFLVQRVFFVVKTIEESPLNSLILTKGGNMRIFVLVFILFTSLSLHSLQASCGLENCKKSKHHPNEKKPKNIWSIDLGASVTDFTYAGKGGEYFEFDLRFSYTSKYDWMVDFKLPYIIFRYDDKETSGFSNPVIAFEKWFSLSHFSPLFGLQLELPVGEEDKGIAPDHFEVLPYIGVSYSKETYNLRLVGGYRFSITDSEHSENASTSEKRYHAGHLDENAPLTLKTLGPTVVNFHAEEELQFCLMGGKSFFDNRFVLGFQTFLRQVIVGEDKLLLIYGGPSFQYNNSFFNLNSQINFPFSSDKKMNWNFGLNLTFDF